MNTRLVFVCFVVCRSLVVVVTDGAAGTAAQWSRDTTFFGFSNVHDCALLSRLLCG